MKKTDKKKNNVKITIIKIQLIQLFYKLQVQSFKAFVVKNALKKKQFCN